eukprot:TRINITY_DN968_c0_g1_i3.p1 TRINITY_DN968_c0_g1~~TRINITY_DN968_c0_g1_i3.p1  ORF type:complete len:247 (-),score=146.14 TRINITY_DN968_c0_g1_i3:81-821(-)
MSGKEVAKKVATPKAAGDAKKAAAPKVAGDAKKAAAPKAAGDAKKAAAGKTVGGKVDPKKVAAVGKTAGGKVDPKKVAAVGKTAGGKVDPKKVAAVGKTAGGKVDPKKVAAVSKTPAGKAGAKVAEKPESTRKSRRHINPVPRPAGIAVGLKRGHIVRKRLQKKEDKERVHPSRRRGKLTRRVKFIREVVRDVCGFAPYERRLLELLRNGLDKRALKYAKNKLGTHLRAKKKRDEMSNSLRARLTA